MDPAATVRRARTAAGLSQHALAKLSHVPQPTVSALETGRRGVSIATLDRILRATGRRLVALPTTGATVADHAASVAEWLTAGDERSAFRQIIQLNDDLARCDPASRVAVALEQPPPVGDERWDALIAALTAYHLNRVGAPHPGWVSTTAPALQEPWFVDPTPSSRKYVEKETPPEFAARNVFLSERELESV